MRNLLAGNVFLKDHSLSVCYGSTTAIVSLIFAARLAFDDVLQEYPFLLFTPGIFLISLFLGRGSGFYATMLSAVASTFFLEPRETFWASRPDDIIALGLFVLIGFGIALLTGALRMALHRLAAAEREKDLLLQEVHHRIRNDLQRMSALLLLERVGAGAEATAKLDRAQARLQVLSRVYERLQRQQDEVAVEVGSFLAELANDLGAAHVGARPIALKITADEEYVNLRCGVALGLAVNELVTNALKYAFPDDRQGVIDIRFRREDDTCWLSICDNGVGLPEGSGMPESTGLGYRLVRQLVQQLEGSFAVTVAQGTCATITLPARMAAPKAGHDDATGKQVNAPRARSTTERLLLSLVMIVTGSELLGPHHVEPG
jgi:two-component sensor histidine kinase